MDVMVSWLAGKLLNCVWDKAVAAASQPKMLEAFEKACEMTIAAHGDMFPAEQLQALSFSGDLPEGDDLAARLQAAFENHEFPNVDELERILLESWEERCRQLRPEDAVKFFKIQKEDARPVLRKIAGHCFTEVSMIPEYAEPYKIKVLQEIRKLPRPEPVIDIFNVPHQRNTFFTGREDVLEELHNDLQSSGSVAISQKQVISGLGGIGKTQTAVEYAYRYRDHYKNVFWVSADTKDILVSGFMSMAELLGLPGANDSDPKKVIMAVLQWFNSNSGWLLVLDNADEPDVLQDFIPTAARGHAIITSRAHDFDSIGITEPVELDKMKPEVACEFLLKRVGRIDPDDDAKTALEELAKTLDCLPLALEQAGAYIKKTGCGFREYLVEHEKQGLVLLEKIKPVTGRYPKSVLTTWSMNFEMVEQISKASADLLRVSAFLHSEKIPLELFTLGAEELGKDMLVQ